MSKLEAEYLKEITLTAGALAAGTAQSVGSKIDTSREQGVFVAKIEGEYEFVGKTDTEGPLYLGMSVGLSGAEIEAIIENDPQQVFDPTTKGGYIKIIGVIPKNGTESPDGETKRFEAKKFIVPEGSGLDFFVYNCDAAQLTAGLVVTIVPVAYTRWLRD